MVIAIDDPLYREGELVGELDYEGFIALGGGRTRLAAGGRVAGHFPQLHLRHHGEPQGVVYHHRGAHLNAINNALSWELPKHPVYLWTLPMFHCNGWCFPGPWRPPPG
nr:hypothetical protein [Aeromonas caviae]